MPIPASHSAGSGEDPETTGATDELDVAQAARSESWTALIEYLHAARGFDFRGYKPTSLIRRVRRRMETLGIAEFSAYQDYLEVHPNEFSALFDTILINVTQFFRDPEAWAVLRREVIPQLLADKRREDPIRAWSAGCASGEEAYTLAILFAEALGPEEFRDRVKIYATDADDGALAQARHATYTPRQVEKVPPELLAKYFERVDGHYIFRKEYRRQVIFGRHNLLQDAPISRIDLIACRNVLMYFNADTQAQILARFHFALNDGGYLFLGRAETLMAHGHIFTPVDVKRRISIKVTHHAVGRRRNPPSAEGTPAVADTPGLRVRELAIEAVPIAVLVTDVQGRIVLVNERARALFGLGDGEVGRPLHDLKLSYRPVELRSVIEQATIERRPVSLRDVEWQVGPGEPRWLDVQVVPVVDGTDASSGTCISFCDVSAAKRLHHDLEHAHQELETAYEELQSTNEELETTNEELETMNEELQSSNTELQSINDELHQRSEELHLANAFLGSVLASLSGGVAVLDRELRLLAWNPQAEELWGLRKPEVMGQHLLDLDVGLPVERLRQPLRACLSGEAERQEIVLEAINRRGRTIHCQVTCTPLRGAEGEIRGAILLMDDCTITAADA